MYCTEFFKLLIKDNTANLFWSLPETIKLPNHIALYHSLLLCRWFRSSMAVFDPDIQRLSCLVLRGGLRDGQDHSVRIQVLTGVEYSRPQTYSEGVFYQQKTPGDHCMDIFSDGWPWMVHQQSASCKPLEMLN